MSSKLYTHKKFNEIANQTNLGDSTLEALEEVLVNGLSSAEACENLGMHPSHLSRGLKKFREKEVELESLSQEQKNAALTQTLDEATQSKFLKQNIIKSEDVNAAREIVGNRVVFVDAEPGKAYSGMIVYLGEANIIQKCGSICVVHNKGMLSKLPREKDMVEIEYSQQNKLAQVNTSPEKQKIKSQDR